MDAVTDLAFTARGVEVKATRLAGTAVTLHVTEADGTSGEVDLSDALAHLVGTALDEGAATRTLLGPGDREGADASDGRRMATLGQLELPEGLVVTIDGTVVELEETVSLLEDALGVLLARAVASTNTGH